MPYEVTWKIELDARGHRAAAAQALQIMRDPLSIATVFDVRKQGSPSSRSVRVDLRWKEGPKFSSGGGGALMSDRHIEGLTQILDQEDSVEFYGGKFFVGETITKAAARLIAAAFGGTYTE